MQSASMRWPSPSGPALEEMFQRNQPRMVCLLHMGGHAAQALAGA